MSNIPFIKHLNDKDVNHSIEELKKIHETFIEKDHLWWCHEEKQEKT